MLKHDWRQTDLTQLDKYVTRSILVTACESGDLDTAQYLIEQLGVEYFQRVLRESLDGACRCDQIAVADWLWTRYHSQIGHPRYLKEIFDRAHRNNQLLVMHWIFDTCEQSMISFSIAFSILIAIMDYEDLALVKKAWACTDRVHASQYYQHHYQSICLMRSVYQAKRAYQISSELGIPIDFGKILSRVCQRSDLKMVEWIYSKCDQFDLSTISKAFANACEQNQPEVARWLRARHPEISIEDDHDSLFIRACLLYYHEVAAFLIECHLDSSQIKYWSANDLYYIIYDYQSCPDLYPEDDPVRLAELATWHRFDQIYVKVIGWEQTREEVLLVLDSLSSKAKSARSSRSAIAD